MVIDFNDPDMADKLIAASKEASRYYDAKLAKEGVSEIARETFRETFEMGYMALARDLYEGEILKNIKL